MEHAMTLALAAGLDHDELPGGSMSAKTEIEDLKAHTSEVNHENDDLEDEKLIAMDELLIHELLKLSIVD